MRDQPSEDGEDGARDENVDDGIARLEVAQQRELEKALHIEIRMRLYRRIDEKNDRGKAEALTLEIDTCKCAVSPIKVVVFRTRENRFQRPNEDRKFHGILMQDDYYNDNII